MDVYDFNAVLVYESNQLKQCDGKAERKQQQADDRMALAKGHL